jgi:uncharacterized membrane-anchored protein YitT (DUF2179 family)
MNDPVKQRTSHTVPEDLFALLVGTLFVGFGLFLFSFQGLLTGGTAGLALVVATLVDFSFGQVFFVINLPFYWLAIRRKGIRFTVNTFVAVACVSLWTDNLPAIVDVAGLNPILAALLGGSLIGTGMLVLLRHNASLGGAGILAMYLQETRGFNAGRIQMALDGAIIGVGFFLVPFAILALSIFGALILNLVIALNFKPGRYQIV